MRFLTLSTQELELVEQLYKTSPKSVVRERCMFLKLSVQKKSMMEISRLMHVGRLRVTLFFNAWEAGSNLFEKEKSLGIKKGRGAKPKLAKVWTILPNLVKENSRNLKVVVDILAKEHQVFVCKRTVKNFLKSARL